MSLGYYTPAAIETDIDIATRWWSDYPVKQYMRLSRPMDIHKQFIREAFYKPAKLARSVSATRFEGNKDVQFDYPIRRSDSVSSFAPSHSQPYEDRVAKRYIDTYKAYEPRSQTAYYHKTLAPYNTRALLREVSKPARRPPPVRDIPRVTYHPEMKWKVQSAFYNKLYRPSSYMDVSAHLLSTHVGSKLRSIGYSVPFVYTSFDQGPLYVAPFDRHVRSGRVLHSRVAPPPMHREGYRTIYRSVAPKYAYKPVNGRLLSHRW